MATTKSIGDGARRARSERRGRRRTGRPVGPARVRVPVLTGAVLVVLTAVATALLPVPRAWALLAVAVVVITVGVVLRRTLTSMIAGAGLFLARPYRPGERVRVFVPCLGRVVEAEVVRVGIANTWLMTGDGIVALANERMLRPAR